MNDEPDMSNIPEDREEFMRRFFAEIRQLRRNHQAQFTMNIVAAVFLLIVLMAVLGNMN